MAKMNYQRLYNQRMQSTKTFIELVVTLNKDHTMEDVKKVAKMMEELYGIKMTLLPYIEMKAIMTKILAISSQTCMRT